MKNKYVPVIGLEIHVELNTRTKMFCGCSADYFGQEPNTRTCPVCLGFPGALPFANREAVESCIKIGLALNCKINPDSRFERKNYFYPDLPKGYQISQYRWPLCVGGKLVLRSGRAIRVNRVHQEEDTAKLLHTEGRTAVDFNRSGVPLVEIVTEPDFEKTEEVVEFAKNFQQIVKDLAVSNANMERGDLRLEANVSLRKIDNPNDKPQVFELPNYRIELKNINSFRFMAHALEYEIKRQGDLLGQGKTLSQETRGWDEDKKETYLQRTKEEAHDYRYFPEPDLPQFSFSTLEVERIKNEMKELGNLKADRLAKDYKIPLDTARILVRQGNVEYFEDIVKTDRLEVLALDVANAIVNKRVSTEDTKEEFMRKIKEMTGKSNISQEELSEAVILVIAENPKPVEDYQKGKENVLQFLVGLVMAKTKGRANPGKAHEILKSKLQMSKEIN